MLEQTTLAERVRRLIEANETTVAAVTRDAGLGGTFIKDILRGKTRSPRGDNLAKLAKGLGVTVDVLLSEKDIGTAAPSLIPGFAEGNDAAPWQPPTSAAEKQALDLDDFTALLCPSARHSTVMRAKNAMPGFAIAAGDLLIVDLNPAEAEASLVLVNSRDRQGGARTLVRRHVPPYLLAPDPDGTSAPLLHDQDQNTIMGVITAVIRAPELAGD